MCRGPLAYGQATATRILRGSGLGVMAADDTAHPCGGRTPHDLRNRGGEDEEERYAEQADDERERAPARVTGERRRRPVRRQRDGRHELERLAAPVHRRRGRARRSEWSRTRRVGWDDSTRRTRGAERRRSSTVAARDRRRRERP